MGKYKSKEDAALHSVEKFIGMLGYDLKNTMEVDKDFNNYNNADYKIYKSIQPIIVIQITLDEFDEYKIKKTMDSVSGVKVGIMTDGVIYKVYYFKSMLDDAKFLFEFDISKITSQDNQDLHSRVMYLSKERFDEKSIEQITDLSSNDSNSYKSSEREVLTDYSSNSNIVSETKSNSLESNKYNINPEIIKSRNELWNEGVTFHSSDPHKAIKCYFKAFELSPHAFLLTNIAECYEKLNDISQATEYYKKAEPLLEKLTKEERYTATPFANYAKFLHEHLNNEVKALTFINMAIGIDSSSENKKIRDEIKNKMNSQNPKDLSKDFKTEIKKQGSSSGDKEKIKEEIRAEYLQSEEFKTFKQALEVSYKNTAQNSSAGYPHTGFIKFMGFLILICGGFNLYTSSQMINTFFVSESTYYRDFVYLAFNLSATWGGLRLLAVKNLNWTKIMRTVVFAVLLNVSYFAYIAYQNY